MEAATKEHTESRRVVIPQELVAEMSRLMTDMLARKTKAMAPRYPNGTDGNGNKVGNDNDNGGAAETVEASADVDRFVAQIKTESAEGFDVEAPWHRNPDTYSSSGTAWFVRPPQQPRDEPTSYLITCAHCVSDAVKDGVTITVPAYSKYAARKNKRSTIYVDVVAVFPDIDAALLHIYDLPSLFDGDSDESPMVEVDSGSRDSRTEHIKFHAYELGDDTVLKNAEKLVIYGHPLGTESIKTVTVQYNGREDFNIQMDGAINEGHSGSAILDERKRVVGHVTSGITFANNVSYGTPVGMLTPLLAAVDLPKKGERTHKTQIVQQGDLGVSFYKSYLQMKDYLGTRCSGGVLVEFIMSTSPLRERLSPNDLLCAIRLSPPPSGGTSTANASAKEEQSGGDLYRWYDITNEGKVEVVWEGSTDVITLRELVNRFPYRAAVDIRYFDASERQVKTIEGQRLDYTPKHGLKALHFPWESPDYEVVAGVVVMPFSRKLRRSAPYVRPNDLDQPAIIVTKILKPSDVARQKVDLTGRLARVNGRDVHTMDDFRRAFVQPENGFLVLENEMHHRVVIPVQDFVQNEPELAKSKRYPLSSLHAQLSK